MLLNYYTIRWERSLTRSDMSLRCCTLRTFVYSFVYSFVCKPKRDNKNFTKFYFKSPVLGYNNLYHYCKNSLYMTFNVEYYLSQLLLNSSILCALDVQLVLFQTRCLFPLEQLFEVEYTKPIYVTRHRLQTM